MSSIYRSICKSTIAGAHASQNPGIRKNLNVDGGFRQADLDSIC